MSGGGVLRRPAVPAAVRVRRDVGNLRDDDPIIRFYREAIGVMKGRPLRDFNSWRFQAAIHDYPVNVATTADRLADQFPDPLARDQDYPLPTDRDKFWRKCQHGGWFFLSWHRMYLHHFEKIVMKTVADLGGPADWALPYWNYSTSPARATVPGPFRAERFNGQPNHLFVQERAPGANTGGAILDANDTSVQCVRARPFGARAPAPPQSFGGGRLTRHDRRDGTAFAGALESAPHNLVHGALGGATGFMGGFVTAPLDPLFWLHHCNIDRLWEVWVQRQKQLGNLDRNPKDAGTAVPGGGWLDEPFDFRDATGADTAMKSRDVINTRIPPLSYEYEDTSDPFNGAP